MKSAPNINFVFDRTVMQQRQKMAWAVLGLVLGMQLGITAWRVQSLQTKQQDLTAQQQKIERKHTSQDELALTPEQRKAIVQTQQMLESIGVPWDPMLQSIEAARPAKLVLDAIQPNAQEGWLKISVNAPEFYTVAEFVQNLRQQSVFAQVSIESEALPESGAGNLRAVIQAQWRKAP